MGIVQPSTLIDVIVGLTGLLLLLVDLDAKRRIWRSPQLERSQRIRQTILVWLLPGAFVAVRYALAPPREPYSDPTVAKVVSPSVDA
jgi:hypothetical protein